MHSLDRSIVNSDSTVTSLVSSVSVFLKAQPFHSDWTLSGPASQPWSLGSPAQPSPALNDNQSRGPGYPSLPFSIHIPPVIVSTLRYRAWWLTRHSTTPPWPGTPPPPGPQHANTVRTSIAGYKCLRCPPTIAKARREQLETQSTWLYLSLPRPSRPQKPAMASPEQRRRCIAVQEQVSLVAPPTYTVGGAHERPHGFTLETQD